ncbi:hypothetical protein [Streptomyces sp. NPDC047042]|uniref:hypothetical protein n=1 Tax=Streptomyces sp. NPDC047042 TaxID=3154807 RepID=UPI0033C02E5E
MRDAAELSNTPPQQTPALNRPPNSTRLGILFPTVAPFDVISGMSGLGISLGAQFHTAEGVAAFGPRAGMLASAVPNQSTVRLPALEELTDQTVQRGGSLSKDSPGFSASAPLRSTMCPVVGWLLRPSAQLGEQWQEQVGCPAGGPELFVVIEMPNQCPVWVCRWRLHRDTESADLLELSTP